MTKASPKTDTALAATDHHDVGLCFIAKIGEFVLALLLPCLSANILAMLGTKRTSEALLLLVTFELNHRGEQRPDQAIANANQSEPTSHLGFKTDPAF